MTLRPWLKGVLAFDIDPERLPAPRLVRRTRELATQLPSLDLTQDDLLTLTIRMYRGIGLRFLDPPSFIARDIDFEAISAAHDLLETLSGLVDAEHDANVQYFWPNMMSYGQYTPIILEWMKTQGARDIFGAILEKTKGESHSENPILASAGRHGYEMFRGEVVGEGPGVLEGLYRLSGYEPEHPDREPPPPSQRTP